MTYTFEFVRRAARNRALWLLALGSSLYACNATDSFSNNSDVPAVANPTPSSTEPEFSTAFAGGIPMGLWSQPTSLFGSRFNGATLNIWPSYLKSTLAAIKSRGGKVVVGFAGNEKYFKTNGHFDMTKWKYRVSRYKGIDFSSYYKDGTIIGHLLIDEPNDPYNWGGQPVTPKQLEEMARYSKSLWPGMATLVRAEPGYVGGGHYYLDGAWAQYVARKGNPSDYIKKHVAAAQKYGLSLVIGMNVRKGGYNNSQMTPSQVANWGSTLLNQTYSCAFLSWEYASFVTNSSYSTAFSLLRKKAQSRTTKSCHS